ncbi:ester cyclase [Mycobacterium gordonae]|uniref:Ester cyclase n=1 Tax=Mycobacterium gordonae TaxID=1778 RepID=A0A0Q2U4Y1_MYCGO|nr:MULTISPECIES: ester cyclase [Mycobacterium]KQH75784.1 ester cyclase [Mycobacterium gordonae]MDP7726604.1 ester cyclase [Mycobacterium sp. TY813]
MAEGDLLTTYRDYLRCLNTRRWDDLRHFVSDDVMHNGVRLRLSGYRAMLESDTRAAPDLQFVPEILIADNQVVSCRLFFQCTPHHVFLGFEPTGGQVSFAEHAFYRFENGRIAEVWSVVDKEAVRGQIAQER